MKYLMLHTKFKGHQSIGAGEENFKRFVSYLGMVAILVIYLGGLSIHMFVSSSMLALY